VESGVVDISECDEVRGIGGGGGVGVWGKGEERWEGGDIGKEKREIMDCGIGGEGGSEGKKVRRGGDGRKRGVGGEEWKRGGAYGGLDVRRGG